MSTNYKKEKKINLTNIKLIFLNVYLFSSAETVFTHLNPSDYFMKIN